MHPYRVEKTRNRHSRAVLKDDVIVIRLAQNLSMREEQRHIENLLGRMSKVAAQELYRPRIHPFKALLEGGNDLTVELCTGQRVHFEFQPGKTTKALPTIGGWSISIGPRTGKKELHRFLWRLLSDSVLPMAELFVHDINQQTMRQRIRSVRLRRMSSQWGSCSPHGDIALNTALFLLPREILEYVTIHELAHRSYSGHGPRFWALVETYSPEMKRIGKICAASASQVHDQPPFFTRGRR